MITRHIPDLSTRDRNRMRSCKPAGIRVPPAFDTRIVPTRTASYQRMRNGELFRREVQCIESDRDFSSAGLKT